MFSRGFNNSLLSIKSPKWIQFTRFKSTSSTTPPTYFSEHLDQSSSPKPIFNEHITPPSTAHSPISSSTYSSSSSESQSSRLSTFKDLSVIFSIVTLTYFAVDNYRSRIGLEARVLEQQMNNMKALALTQNNYNNQRRKRETQVLNERRNAQKREMKMVYHISMLRKQLIDAGLKPVEIDEAISEFEKNVKMENSISNVSGTALWVIDESPMKAYVPNIHDYETKK